MQKKLLIIFMAINCIAIHASEGGENISSEYSEYENQRKLAFQSAFINFLCDNEAAITDELSNGNMQNSMEAKASYSEYYDGDEGYFGSKPTSKSLAGRMRVEFADSKQAKDDLNVKLAAQAKEKAVKFNNEILPQFITELHESDNFIAVYCVPALKKCGNDPHCYGKRISPVPAEIFTNPDFGAHREELLYACVATFSSEHGIHLTFEEIRMIAEHNKATQKCFNGIQESIKEMHDVREEILNPKKKEDNVELRSALEIDIKKEQGDQGALSQ